MKLIHKVNISPEAVFDYEECITLGKLDKYTLKNELEEYIGLNDRLREKHYFHCKYYDDNLGQMLRVFVYRKNRLGLMQLWEIAGICQAEHWDEDIEDEGIVKSWLNTKIDITLESKYDWVLALRELQIRQETGQRFYRLIGLPGEVENAIFSGTDNDISEKLSHLQRKGGKWVGYRRHCPEHKSSRKMHKCTR